MACGILPILEAEPIITEIDMIRLTVRFFLISVSLLAVLILSISCGDGEHPITIDNRSNQTLEIFVGLSVETPEKYYQIGTVRPNEIVTIGRTHIFTHYGYPRLIEVKTEAGMVVFSEWYTPKELEKLGWKIVIEPKQR